MNIMLSGEECPPKFLEALVEISSDDERQRIIGKFFEGTGRLCELLNPRPFRYSADCETLDLCLKNLPHNHPIVTEIVERTRQVLSNPESEHGTRIALDMSGTIAALSTPENLPPALYETTLHSVRDILQTRGSNLRTKYSAVDALLAYHPHFPQETEVFLQEIENLEDYRAIAITTYAEMGNLRAVELFCDSFLRKQDLNYEVVGEFVASAFASTQPSYDISAKAREFSSEAAAYLRRRATSLPSWLPCPSC